jgi:hypothetical protein
VVADKDKIYIFAFIPSELEKQYKSFIKKTIRQIAIENKNIICESDFIYPPDADYTSETWKHIVNSSVIIADVTRFDPAVMLNLGMAMIKKESIILIGEKPLKKELILPSMLQGMEVVYYDPMDLNEFSRRLVSLVKNKLISPVSGSLSPYQTKMKEDSTHQPDRIASPELIYGVQEPLSGIDTHYNSDKYLYRKKTSGVMEMETESWHNIVTMYAQVDDIDDENGVVYLNCKKEKDSDESFERSFPLKHFKNKDKLKVDQSILAKIYEKPGEVRFLFEETDEDFFDQEMEDISIDAPDYDEIFKPL